MSLVGLSGRLGAALGDAACSPAACARWSLPLASCSPAKGHGARGEGHRKPSVRGLHTSHCARTGREDKKVGNPTFFPDFIDAWGRRPFFATGAVGTAAAASYVLSTGAVTVGTVGVTALLGAYWAVGLNDIKQEHHAIRKNFPILGNIRYLAEVLRPEVHQYFVEGETEGKPFSRMKRGIAYQRAKAGDGLVPFGTRFNVYEEGYEWAVHSLWPRHIDENDTTSTRVTIGGPSCKQPYSASILNISAMSYGALSDNAILALNRGAKMGGFYHNTGEGGISRFHDEPGGDIVWNIGTGYFGCRAEDGSFSAEKFEVNAAKPNVKMIEIKCSQGAKPGHGGILPKAKITPLIAEARGVSMEHDCVSPPSHSAFSNPDEFVDFIALLRKLSGGKPVGFKLCVGRPEELAAVIRVMAERPQDAPDFITVDGGEGGTGAAPAEFTNRVGMPLVEGLTVTDSMLRGAGLRDQVKIIASGRVVTAWALMRTLALGADVCNSARGMMFALGCIQALKCHTNRCPTGITTQDKQLMGGLDVGDKATRVHSYHKVTVRTVLELVGAVGLSHPTELERHHIWRRVQGFKVSTLAGHYPVMADGYLLTNLSPRQDELEAMAPSQRTIISAWRRGGQLVKESRRRQA